MCRDNETLFPDATMVQRLVHDACVKTCPDFLKAYAQATGKLICSSASRGESGVVIKFRIEDYVDEEECSRAITSFALYLNSMGYKCFKSTETYVLSQSDKGINTEIMKNPAILALTIMW